MKMHRILFCSFAVLVLAACQGEWHIDQVWARPTLAGGNAAVYFEIHNGTANNDAIIGASSDIADAVEIHQSMEVSSPGMDMQATPGAGDPTLEAQDLNMVGSMAPVSRVEIPINEDVVFMPGGYHIMLIGLKQDLKEGDTFPLTLHFENSEDLVVTVTVVEQ